MRAPTWSWIATSLVMLVPSSALSEYQSTFRRIPTDGRGHPADLDPTFIGDSVGRWEHDTLVVDVVGFNDLVGHRRASAQRRAARGRTHRRTGRVTTTAEWTLKEHACEENNKIGKPGQKGR